MLGPPNNVLSNGTEWRYGSHGSLALNLSKNCWYDHEAGTGGGVNSFKEHVSGQLPGAKNELVAYTPTPMNRLRLSARRIESVYRYEDEFGVLRYEVIRFAPKDFRSRRFVGNDTVWNLKGITRLPYRLPEMLSRPNDTVAIVEGERDVDTLYDLGVLATCNTGGAGSWSPEINRWFKDRRVVILPDRDNAGASHAEKVVAALSGVAEQVVIADESYLMGKDATEWVENGATADDFQSLLDRALSVPAEPPLTLLTEEDIEALPPVEWLVSELIMKNSFSLLYGPPCSGKSFLALDMAMCVSRGTSWHGHATASLGPAVYVAAEGFGGMSKRLKAWKQYHGADKSAFRLMPATINLLNSTEVDMLAATLATIDPPSLLIVDTLSRAMIGDENSAEDISQLFCALDALRARFEFAVLLVHHSGKDVSRGARGSSALLAAVDTCLQVKHNKEKGQLKLTVEKQRDSTLIAPLTFDFHTVELVSEDVFMFDNDKSIVLIRKE